MHLHVVDHDSLKSLYKATVIRAIKDYQYQKYRLEIMNWVVEMQGNFPLCAEAMGLSVYNLRELMVDKMIEIDSTHQIYRFKEARMRK